MQLSLVFAACASMSLFCPVSWAAEKYPSHPVKIIVPFGVGGTGDIMARLVAQRLTEQTGQPFVVENRVGAGGRIGYAAVATSVGDGYTLVAIDATYTMLPALFNNLQWDAEKDLIPVTMTARAPFVLVTNVNTKLQSFNAFLDAAKASPGKINYGSAGNGSVNHVVTTFFANSAKLELTQVPYKGMGEALMGMLGGSVEMVLTAMPTVISQVKAGKINALAVTSEKRSPSLPNVPTVAESGIPFVAINWFGLAAPKGTPKEVTEYLQKEVAKALQLPVFRDNLTAMGAEPVGNSPEEFGNIMREDVARWGKVIRGAGIRLD